MPLPCTSFAHKYLLTSSEVLKFEVIYGTIVLTLEKTFRLRFVFF